MVWSTLEDVRRWVPLSDARMPTLGGKWKVPHFDGKGEIDHVWKDLGVPTTLLGFPGADDLGNMFQFKRDFNEDFRAPRSVEKSRQLNPKLATFEQWLAAHAGEIPAG